jgi:hypothetical protein
MKKALSASTACAGVIVAPFFLWRTRRFDCAALPYRQRVVSAGASAYETAAGWATAHQAAHAMPGKARARGARA